MAEGGHPEPAEQDLVLSRGSGICKWFNVRRGFGFLSMSSNAGVALHQPLDVFVHQSKLHMKGFRSLREGEAVEFTFKKSSKGLESVMVTGPNGAPCLGSAKRLKKRRSKGDECYNCGGPGHHAKECQLPPQPKKCHLCQSISHMVASCPVRAQRQQLSASPHSQGPSEGDKGGPQSQMTPPLKTQSELMEVLVSGFDFLLEDVTTCGGGSPPLS